jgi:hypothetical protein
MDVKIESIKQFGQMSDVRTIATSEYNVTVGIYGTYKLYRHPFANCQTCVMANFASFLKCIERLPKVEQKQFLHDFAKELSVTIGKRQIMVDIHQELCDLCETFFPNFLFKTPYVNSTTSKMVAYLLKIY